jgi:hypothetical protein
MTTYPPALNTVENLGSLFESHGNIANSRTMYSKPFTGNTIVFGPGHSRSRSLPDKVRALDVVIKGKALEVEESVGKETSSKSKLHKPFRKLGLR